MEIQFASEQIAELVNNKRKMQSIHGKPACEALERLMRKLYNAKSLHEFWPPYSKATRCHVLTQKTGKHDHRRGLFSMRIVGGLRLVFEPKWSNEEEVTRTWQDIKTIIICQIEDYHD